MALKGTKAQIDQRITEIYSLLLSRVNRAKILEYARNKWGEIGNSTVDAYIKRARDLIQKDTQINRESALAEHIASRNQLYQIALKKEKLQTCLQILDSTAKLQGLFITLDQAIEVVTAHGFELSDPTSAIAESESQGKPIGDFSDILRENPNTAPPATATDI